MCGGLGRFGDSLIDKLAAHKRYRPMRINGTALPYTCIVLPVFLPIVKRRASVDNSTQVHWNLNPMDMAVALLTSIHTLHQHHRRAG